MARNLELERTLAGSPDDAETYRVYADWLIDHGDLRGELIARSLEHEVSNDHKLGLMIDGMIARNATTLAGELAMPLGYIRWRRGFFDEVTIDRSRVRDPFAPLVEKLLAHPSAALLRSLVLNTPDGAALAASFAVLARVNPPALHTLKLGVDRNLGALDALFPVAITRLEIDVPRGADYPTLDPITPALLQSLVAAPWPLHTLVLHTGVDPTRLDGVVRFLDRADLPLTKLHLAASHRDLGFARALVRAIVASPLAAQLVELHLDLEIAAADYQWLDEKRARLPALTRLEIPRGKFRRRPR